MSSPIVSQLPGFFSPINQAYSTDPDQQVVQFTKLQSETSRYINQREIAIYQPVEVPSGQQWFDPTNAQVPRFGFRKVFKFSDASLTFNHNITGITLCTYIGGGFTDGALFYPLPFVDPTAANQVGLHVSATQVIVTKGAGAPAITSGVVVLEYLKQ